MAAFIDPILRGVLFVFLAIALGLTGSLIHGSDEAIPQVKFGLFSAIFGIVFGVGYGLAAAFIEALAFPIIIACFDFLNWVFLFAGATSIAAALGAHSCGNHHYVDGNVIAQGSSDRCRKAQGSVAFLYFAFFTIFGLLAYSIVSVISNGAFSLPSRKRSVPRTGVPTMSQV